MAPPAPRSDTAWSACSDRPEGHHAV